MILPSYLYPQLERITEEFKEFIKKGKTISIIIDYVSRICPKPVKIRIVRNHFAEVTNLRGCGAVYNIVGQTLFALENRYDKLIYSTTCENHVKSIIHCLQELELHNATIYFYSSKRSSLETYSTKIRLVDVKSYPIGLSSLYAIQEWLSLIKTSYLILDDFSGFPQLCKMLEFFYEIFSKNLVERLTGKRFQYVLGKLINPQEPLAISRLLKPQAVILTHNGKHVEIPKNYYLGSLKYGYVIHNKRIVLLPSYYKVRITGESIVSILQKLVNKNIKRILVWRDDESA